MSMRLPSLLMRLVFFALRDHCIYYDVLQIWADRESYKDLNEFHIIQMVVYEEMRPEYPDPPIRGQDAIWPILQECWKAEPGNRLAVQTVVKRLGF